MAETITVGLIGKQDLSLGYGTYSTAVLDGSTQTFDKINLSDFYVAYTVTYSATPVFNLVNGTVQTITLTGNVTSSTITNGSDTVPTGARFVIRIVQDGTGSRTFVFPTNVTGRAAVTIGSVASAITIAELLYNGTNWEFVGSPIIAGTMALTSSQVTGSGTANYLSKFSSASVIANSVAYDDGTRILVGLTSSDVSGGSLITALALVVATAATNAEIASFSAVNGSYTAIAASKTGAGTYRPLTFWTSGAEAMRIQTNGRLLIGATSSQVTGSIIDVFGSPPIITLTTATTNASVLSMSCVSGSYSSFNSGKTGSGTYLPFNWETGGAERMRLDTTGRLLIGSTSTEISGGSLITTLAIVVATAATNAEVASFSAVAGSYTSVAASKTGSGTYRPMTFWTSAAEAMRIETTGRVLIGLTSSDIGTSSVVSAAPIATASATSNAEIMYMQISSGNYGVLYVGKTGSGTYRPMTFWVSNGEKMRIETTGRVLVGLASSDISGTSLVVGVSMAFATATTNASIGSLGAIVGSYFSISSSKTGSGTYLPIAFFTSSLRRIDIGVSGGLIIKDGSGVDPTGGDKGAGTINLATDIYKNNTAYTNPDYVFEHFYTKQVRKFADRPGAQDYSGLMPLDALRAHVQEKWQLPRVGRAMGIFERGDMALEQIESLYLHIFDLQDQIKELKRRPEGEMRVG